MIGRHGNNLQFSDQRERSENTKNSIKTLSIAEKNIRLCGNDDDDVTKTAGSEETGNPTSIYYSDGGDDTKEKLNSAVTSALTTVINRHIYHHQYLLGCCYGVTIQMPSGFFFTFSITDA